MSERKTRRTKEILVEPPLPPRDSSFTITAKGRTFQFTSEASQFQERLQALTSWLPILLDKFIGEEEEEEEERLKLVSVESDYRVLVDEDVILCNSKNDAFTVFLPSAVWAGRKLVIIKTNTEAKNITVQAFGNDTIEGSSSKTLANQYDKLTVISNGVSTWFNLASNPIT
jgi:hypothetical protein